MMATSSKPRKRYRPKPVLKDTMSYVLSGLKRLPENIVTKLKIEAHWGMSTMTKGEGTRDDWERVATVLNIGVALSEAGYGPEYLGALQKAQTAMMNMRVRLRQTGRMVFTGPEINAINEALSIHEAQLDSPDLNVLAVERAVAQVQRQLRAGQHVAPGVIA